MIACFLAAMSGFVEAGTRTIDGSSGDWVGTAPTTINSYTISAGELIWKDNTGDERTDLSPPDLTTPDNLVDMLEFRVTADTENVYFMVKMNDIWLASGDNAPMVQVAVDNDRVAGSGENWFGGWCETATHTNAEWERLIHTRFGSNAGRVFIWDTGWNDLATAGDTESISTTNEVIEFKVGWARLGTKPPCTLRFTVASFRSDILDNAKDIAGSSDALDALTHVSGNTWEDVQDQVVDNYFDVYFLENGDVGTAPPPPPVVATVDGNIWWDQVRHDQNDPSYFSPQGVAGTFEGATGRKLLYDENADIRIRVAENDLSKVVLRWWKQPDNVGGTTDMVKDVSDGTYEWWKTTVVAPGVLQKFFYRFYLVDDNGLLDSTIGTEVTLAGDDDIDTYGDHSTRDGGTGAMYGYPGTDTGPNDPFKDYDFLIIFYENIPPPKPSLLSPANGAQLTRLPTLRWTKVTDPSGVTYHLQVDNSSDFTSPLAVDKSNLTDNSYFPSTLGVGIYYWRVRAVDGSGNVGDWSTENWKFEVLSTAFLPPTLISPAIGENTTDSTPTFKWTSIAGTAKYQIQVDDDSDFSSPAIDENVSENTYTPSVGLAEGNYFWRVNAYDAEDKDSGWSSVCTFIISAPSLGWVRLISPAPNAFLALKKPTFMWENIVSKLRITYELQVDENRDFSSPILSENGLSVTSFTMPTELQDRTYYWRVQAWDELGRSSGWSEGSFSIDTATPEIPVVQTQFPSQTCIKKWLVMGSAEPGAKIRVYVNGNFEAENVAGADGKFGVFVNLRVGTNTITMKVVDAAGNESASTSAQTVEYAMAWGPSVTIAEIKAGTKGKFDFKPYGQTYGLSLLEIVVKPTRTLVWPTIIVEELLVKDEESLPPDVQPLRGVEVYRYLHTDTSFPEGLLESAKFSFTVEISWLKEKGLAAETIRLWLFKGEWKPIETEYEGEADGYAYYSSGTSELSGVPCFAVASMPPPSLIYLLVAVVCVAGACVGGYLLVRRGRARWPHARSILRKFRIRLLKKFPIKTKGSKSIKT
ncbi:MAG: PGF-pre-PGF domain-containing protein, partial [Hadesarchaea archaeon]|nr:PGF-pre-PGF domain-containing protein [Hadesarchaea archaeon]